MLQGEKQARIKKRPLRNPGGPKTPKSRKQPSCLRGAAVPRSWRELGGARARAPSARAAGRPGRPAEIIRLSYLLCSLFESLFKSSTAFKSPWKRSFALNFRVHRLPSSLRPGRSRTCTSERLPRLAGGAISVNDALCERRG